MMKILYDRFIELINSGQYTDEELKQMLYMILGEEVDLHEFRKLLLGAAK